MHPVYAADPLVGDLRDRLDAAAGWGYQQHGVDGRSHWEPVLHGILGALNRLQVGKRPFRNREVGYHVVMGTPVRGELREGIPDP